MGRHTRHADLSDEAFLAVAEANVEALNYALENIPMEQVRIHVCWGNYAGPHHHDIAAAEIWPVVAKVKAKFILTEAANPRHAQDAKAFEDACARGLFEAHKSLYAFLIAASIARQAGDISPPEWADLLKPEALLAGGAPPMQRTGG